MLRDGWLRWFGDILYKVIKGTHPPRKYVWGHLGQRRINIAPRIGNIATGNQAKIIALWSYGSSALQISKLKRFDNIATNNEATVFGNEMTFQVKLSSFVTKFCNIT